MINNDERKSFLNQEVSFNNNVVEPIPEDVVTMIKAKFTFVEEFDLAKEFEILRMHTAWVKFKDDSIPRQAKKNKLLNTIGASIKSLMASIKDLDNYTFFVRWSIKMIHTS